MKKIIVNIIKSVVFLAGIIAVVAALGPVFTPKGNTRESGINNPKAKDYLAEPDNTIQVVAIGNSDIYSGFSPMEIWHNYGYTCVSAGEGAQVIYTAKNRLEEIYKNQKPDVVVFDVDELFYGNFKVRVAKTAEAVFEKYLPFVMYHDNWKLLFADEETKANIKYETTYYKGQMIDNRVLAVDPDNPPEECHYGDDIPYIYRKTFDEFAQMCKDHGTKLLLIYSPTYNTWTKERHDSIAKYAEENDLDFIDFNDGSTGVTIDWSVDTRDGGKHLNSAAAKRVTLVVGDFIKDNYDLTDNRGNDAYKQWDSDYERYVKKYESTKGEAGKKDVDSGDKSGKEGGRKHHDKDKES